MEKLKINFNFKKILIFFSFFLAILVGISLLPYFRLAQIEISGMEIVKEEEATHLLQEPLGKPMVFLLASPKKERLMQHPWIKEAEITYVFPNRMEIAIVEREILAYLPYYGNLMAVSADGTALTICQDLPRLELLFSGLELPFLAIGEKIPGAELMQDLQEIVAKMDDHFKDMVSEIRYSEGYFYLHTTDRYKIRVNQEITEQQLNDMRTVIVFMRGQKIKGTVVLQGDKPVFLPD